MKVNLASSVMLYKDLLSLWFNIVGDTTSLRPVPNQEYDRCLWWIKDNEDVDKFMIIGVLI